MSTQAATLFDSDGHLVESLADMAPFLHPAVRANAIERSGIGRALSMSAPAIFGSLDGLHFVDVSGTKPPRVREKVSDHRTGSAEDWIVVLDKGRMEGSVLYPTEALGVGALRNPEYASSICRSYNDYVGDCYGKKNSRLYPIAILPMQSPQEAARELRRAVRELGFLGGMLPGSGLPVHLGHEYYWPVYEEADRLGCVLAVHGGSNRGLGLDSFSKLGASHILHHPITAMNAMVSFVYDGVFDRFQSLRVAFLEGGAAWVGLLLDRAARDEEVQIMHMNARRPFEEYVAGGRVLIGCEGVDPSLPYLASRVGIEPFAYSSDYPHEVDFKHAMHEVEETMESGKLTDSQKQAVLGGNARRFYLG